jgi:hypothetical protein
MSPPPRRRPATPATPVVLAQAPHLALLDVLEHALRVAVWALLAEFPTLAGDPHPWRPDPPDQLAARRLLSRMQTFDRTLVRYRRIAITRRTPTPPVVHDGDEFDG